MKYNNSYYFSLIFLIAINSWCFSGYSQNFTQTIKGTVYDKNTELPLPGVTIILTGTNPLIGTISDNNGSYSIKNLPVSRYNIQASFIGYEVFNRENIMLSSAREMVINIFMEEKVYNAKEVIVKAYKNKALPINAIATVSARSFTVEETNRYAGSFGDPARMASNYAGVVSMSTERNDIVIRGNSPIGLLWKLDGVEIPNPNHFGVMGTTGGPITILNYNFLSQSDFFTGAFPAEYSNALSGVFDLNMRTGNKDRHEYWAQMGWNGFEVGAEGPIWKSKQATYIADIRYSMFEVASKLGLDFYTPIYSDFTFKLDFPSQKNSKTEVFAIGGKSLMKLWDSYNDSTEWTYSNAGEDITFGSGFACFSVSNTKFFNKKTRLKTNLSIIYSENTSKNDTFYLTPEIKVLQYGEKSKELKYSLSGKLKFNVSKKNYFETGYYLDVFDLSLKDSVYRNGGFQKLSNTAGTMTMYRHYLQMKHKFNAVLSFNFGVNVQYLFFNQSFSAEPRMGFIWKISNTHSLSLATGLYSQMQPRTVYFYQTQIGVNQYIETNRNLDFSKSIHVVLGYDYFINEDTRLKAESYFQYLYNIPVKKEGFPEYSLINAGGDYWVGRQDSLVNKGTGKNIGIDITVERFFKNNFYYLLTMSLFNSNYKGSDGIVRNTTFNQNFLVNILGGYELIVKDKNFVTFNIKNVFSGGKRYVPIDLVASSIAGETVYDWSNAYEKRYNNFFRTDIRIGYKINRRKASYEIATDLQNITNSKQPFLKTYDPTTNKVKSKLQFGFLPMLTIKVEF
ncbi:MAG: TonB-dependent receptor [Chlorobi bacterium]|nr:TonB-dependent receptor [Chlorobiota bacterium]